MTGPIGPPADGRIYRSVTGGTTAFASAAAGQAASIDIGAGFWDVQGVALIAVPVGYTVKNIIVGISTDPTDFSFGLGSYVEDPRSFTSNGINQLILTPPVHAEGSDNLYLVVYAEVTNSGVPTGFTVEGFIRTMPTI